MLRFTVLGSGSTGNATLIEAYETLGAGGQSRPTRVLIDCGLTLRALSQRLADRELAVDQIDAVFVTHEHSDHVGCLASLLRRHPMPVWTSEGTWRGSERRLGALPAPMQFARSGEAIHIGALQLMPFSVPHDANEPLQIVATDGVRRLGIATDLGEPNDAVIEALRFSHTLLLESNHDESMLEEGPYPYFLRRRIAGPRGHLGNAQAATILDACRHETLNRVVAAHLSQHNNTPALVAASFASILGCHADDIAVADPKLGTPWFEV